MTARMFRVLASALLAALVVVPAHADESAEANAERLSARVDQSAEACAARISARVDAAMQAAEAAAERAAARAAERSRPGVFVTPRTIYYVDGPEIPIDLVEWADGSGARHIRRPMSTDTTLRVRAGITLALSNLGGDIQVRTWDRNEVHVVAEHDRDDRIVSEQSDGVLRLRVIPRLGLPAEVEWVLTVPQWLPVRLSGMEGDISVTGLRAAVQAQTVRGDVMVEACRGPLQVNSIEGEVHVLDVDGTVTAGSVNNIIRLVRVNGAIDVQTVNGDIQLEKLLSPNVDASTVNGRVFYASPYQPHGRYAFASHNGRIYVTVPTDQNVNVTMSSFNGRVESSAQVPPPAPPAMGRPIRFTMGELPALPDSPEAPRAPRSPRTPRAARAPQAPELELESFGGSIRFGSEAEVLRALQAQRALMDSLRSALMRERGERVKLQRLTRRLTPAPAPEAAPAPREH